MNIQPASPSRVPVKNKHKPSFIVFVLVLLMIISVGLVFFLQFRIRKIEKEERQKIEANVTEAEIFERYEDEIALRGGFDRIDKNIMYFWGDRSMKEDPRTVDIEKDTIFACVPKYQRNKEGRVGNRTMVPLDFTNFPIPNPEFEKRKDLIRNRSWFEDNIYKGDVIEVWYSKDSDGKKLYAIIAIIDGCKP